jgi:hypothetical protein
MQDLASIVEQEARVKDYIGKGPNSIIAHTMTQVTNGTYPLKANVDFKSDSPQAKTGLSNTKLGRAYQNSIAERAEKARLEKARQARTQTSGQDAKGPSSQAKIMARLSKLENVKKMTGTGHDKITMTKIQLDNPVTLRVAGKDRKITHLYTQIGAKSPTEEKTELRCYLGNKSGAYQRVHTSLTQEKDEMTSHTMVQTGSKVSIPQWRGGGERVGFDSREKKGEGFAARELNIRHKEQCKVKDWIKARDWDSLTKEQQDGCKLLAKTFNKALDRVCRDVNKGEIKNRTVTGITDKFKILDDTAACARLDPFVKLWG